MLRELLITPDEPKSILDNKLREAYIRIVGREPDMEGLMYFSNAISRGEKTFADMITDLNYGLDTELGQYVAQGNGNPINNIILRDNDGTVEPYEAAFNTNLQRKQDLFYVKTGDIISLPYTHQIYLQNKLASGTVNINPYGVSTFVGLLSLNPPDNSLEHSATSTPTVVNDPNDNYKSLVDSYKTSIANKEGKTITQDDSAGFYGSYYGEWELLSQGTQELDPKDNKVKRVDDYGKYKIEFSIKPQTTTSLRSGVRRDIVYDQNLNPKMNDINIGFFATGMKPRTRIYAFFGDRDVTNMCIQHNEVLPDLDVGFDMPSKRLITDSKGEIRGTFSYRQSDLNFDAGIYLLHLSDSLNNSDNRTTYASAPFNGLGLTGYGAEEFRTRIGVFGSNKTSTVAVRDPRTVVVADGPPPPPPEAPDPPPAAESTLDIIDFCFVYGFGRKPSQAEKAGIYDKWQGYGVGDMTTWNGIVNKNPTNDANTDGSEMWYTVGWPVNHEIMTYVDRAISVVPNGSDSSDLRSKYLAAVTYPYGRWTWWYYKNNPALFPPTINYTQLINTDQSVALTAPWETDLPYDSFNIEGKKVFDALVQFPLDVHAINGGLKATDYQGVMGFYARLFGYIYLDSDNNPQFGTAPQLPKTYTLFKNIPEGGANVHVITTVWDSIGNDCMQPYKATVVTSTPEQGSNLNITISSALGYYTHYSWVLIDSANVYGNLKVPRGTMTGSGKGALWTVNQPDYPLSLSFGNYLSGKSNVNVFNGSNAFNWAHTDEEFLTFGTTSTLAVGGSEGSPLISGTPYVLAGVHYAQTNGIKTAAKVQIAIAIKEGEVGLSTNLPITVKIKNTSATYNTWIPGTGGAGYWDDLTSSSNFVDIYPEGTDPLGLIPLLTSQQPFTIEISTRSVAAAPPPPPNTTYFDSNTGGNDVGDISGGPL
jgi:hypothetical protein